MTLEEIATKSTLANRDGPDDWPSRVIAMARDLDVHLSEPDGLRAVVGELVSIAKRLECDSVAGASPIGERLAGAVAASDHGLRLFARGQSARSVLVLDGMLATGVQLTRAMHLAREGGALHTPAATLMADRDSLRALRARSHEEVFALREF